MDLFPLILLLLVFCVIVILVDRIRAVRNRRSLLEAEFPARWYEILRKNVPIYERLPETLQAELRRHVLVFIDEKEFEACGDLPEVTEEMQVTIAAYACLLLVNKARPYYARLRTILVYPDDFWVDADDEFGEEVRSGESWDTGSVVLSWESVKQTGKHTEAGLNVALHEFAHQVDQHGSGTADGMPALDSVGAYRAWSKAFGPAFADLQKRSERGEAAPLDDYGAESPAEFFAVATEAFYETPQALNAAYPDVFAALRSLYKVDPGLWAPSPVDLEGAGTAEVTAAGGGGRRRRGRSRPT